MPSSHGGKKVIVIAFAMNGIIAIVKSVVAAITRSSAMAAEAMHSWADTGNQVLLLVGMKQSHRGADSQHPFGRGKETYFWSFVVAVCLFTMGACYSIYEGVHKILHPPAHLEHLGVAVGVLIVAIILETVSFAAAIREVRLQKGNRGYFEHLRGMKNTELMVVFLEDAAAEIGLILALIGLLLCHFTGWMIFDGIASTAIGILLLVVTYFLSTEIKSLLIGESAGAETEQKIRSVVEANPQAGKLIALNTLQMGAEHFIVSLKLDFPDSMVVADVEREINQLETQIRAVAPHAYKIFVEPDSFKEDYKKSS